MPAARRKPPEISPYVFPALLAGFGLWCLYDGWLNANPEMQEHLLFNRLTSAVLLPWAAFDAWRTRRTARASVPHPPGDSPARR